MREEHFAFSRIGITACCLEWENGSEKQAYEWFIRCSDTIRHMQESLSMDIYTRIAFAVAWCIKTQIMEKAKKSSEKLAHIKSFH